MTRLERDFGRLDVLINNVEMTSAERFAERDVATIRLELEVNLISPPICVGSRPRDTSAVDPTGGNWPRADDGRVPGLGGRLGSTP